MKERRNNCPMNLVLICFLVNMTCSEFLKLKLVKASPEQIKCDLRVMRSYLLKGRKYSTQKRNSLICPIINNNCCQRLDEQKAFHTVNEILPSRLFEYQEKIKSALTKLRQLRKVLMQQKPNFQGDRNRISYCVREYRKFESFGFNNFYEETLRLLEKNQLEMKEHYSSFFCILCDARNHANFIFERAQPNIIVNTRFCDEMLAENKELLELLNVELVGFMRTTQNVVDCHHYKQSYNLRFFDREKQKISGTTAKCLNSLGSVNFMPDCKDVCDKITYSKIVDILDGDYDFMTVGVNLFEKLLDHQEQQVYVSNALRAFFKSFLKLDKVKDITDDDTLVGLDRKLDMNYDHSRKVRKLKEQTFKSASDSFDLNNEITEEKSESSLNRKQKITKLNQRNKKLSKSKFLRKFKHRPLFEPTNSILYRKKKKKSPFRNYSLKNKGRLLKTIPKTVKEEDESTASEKVRKLIPLVYSRELKNMYRLIDVGEIINEKTTVFELERDPVMFDDARRLYDFEGGVNPKKYILNFGQSDTDFYNKLFSYRKPEKPNMKLGMFLADFTDALKAEGQKYVKVDIVIEPKFWVNPRIPESGVVHESSYLIKK